MLGRERLFLFSDRLDLYSLGRPPNERTPWF